MALLFLSAAALGDRPAPSPPYYKPVPKTPSYRPAPAPYKPAEPSYHPVDYAFAYDVQDDYSGVDFDAQEERKG